MLRTILAAVLKLALSVGVQASAHAQSTDAEQLADFVSPKKDAPAVTVEVEGLKAWLLLNIGFSGRGPTFDETLLESSFAEAVRSADADYRRALVAALDAGDASRREEALKFFRSAVGQHVLAEQRRHDDQVRAWLNAPKDKREAEPPKYVPSEAEKAFATSDTVATLGNAVADARKKVEQLPTAMERAASIYCAKSSCQNGEQEMFRRMYASAHMSSARGEHAMWGKTAADIFPGASQAALARAACEGDVAGVELAVASGADPNLIGAEGKMKGGWTYDITPLFWALDCASVEGVRALLGSGADPNMPVNDRRSAMMFAAENDPAILRVMLDHGGDPNAHDDRETALTIALNQQRNLRYDGASEQRVRANWEMLLAAGADINLGYGGSWRFSNTPAGMAALSNDWPMVLELLNRGYSHNLAELAAGVEMVDIHPDPDRQAAKRDVIGMLRAKGMSLPYGRIGRSVDADIGWMDYRTSGGQMARAKPELPTAIGVSGCYQERKPPFEAGDFQLWYLADVDTFVEVADTSPLMRELTPAEILTRWGVAGDQLAAIRKAPNSWEKLCLP